MALPTTTYELFDLLAADATLAGLLGTYLYRSGDTMPALAHLWKNELMDPDVKPRGVEIIVWRMTQDNPQVCATGEVIVNPTMSLSATQWLPAILDDPRNLQEAIRRLQILLPGCRASDVTTPDLTTGLQQQSVSWTAPLVIGS